jgi:hypothetical protein
MSEPVPKPGSRPWESGPGSEDEETPQTQPAPPEQMRPTPSGSYRESRPGWAPSANPRGFNEAELAALTRFFETRQVGTTPTERKIQMSPKSNQTSSVPEGDTSESQSDSNPRWSELEAEAAARHEAAASSAKRADSDVRYANAGLSPEE